VRRETVLFVGRRLLQLVPVVLAIAALNFLLLKMAPGARLPDHEHVLIEQTFVLQGSLVCGEGVCGAGDFVWRPAGSRHEAWAGPEGGLMIGIFQIPNRFYDRNGQEVDFLGNNWDKVWGEAYARHEQARFA